MNYFLKFRRKKSIFCLGIKIHFFFWIICFIFSLFVAHFFSFFTSTVACPAATTKDLPTQPCCFILRERFLFMLVCGCAPLCAWMCMCERETVRERQGRERERERERVCVWERQGCVRYRLNGRRSKRKRRERKRPGDKVRERLDGGEPLPHAHSSVREREGESKRVREWVRESARERESERGRERERERARERE